MYTITKQALQPVMIAKLVSIIVAERTTLLQTPIRITTPASRFLHATFLARYATLLARYATLLARYATLLARYDTLLARYATLLARYAFRPLR
jgi:hypothetical protein